MNVLFCCVAVLTAMSSLYAAKANAVTFTYGSSRGATLLDPNGTTIQTWTTVAAPYSAHLTDSGSVWFTSGSAGGGGSTGCSANGAPWTTIKEVDWNGNTLHTITTTQLGGGSGHHAITPTSKGTILAVLLESYNGVCGERIVEYDPKLGKVIWAWHTGDHEGTTATKLKRGTSSSDPYHINNMDWNEISNKIVFSAHNVYEVFVIDRSIDSVAAKTSAGDIQWRIGKPANYGVTGNQFIDYATHSARWVKPGYPGEGNIVFYANKSPYNSNYATGYEFKPVYELSNGEWQYELIFKGTNSSTTQANQGGMDKVYNGNWLVTFSNESSTAYEFDYVLGASQNKTQAVATWTSAGSNGLHRYPVCYGAIEKGSSLGNSAAASLYSSNCSAVNQRINNNQTLAQIRLQQKQLQIFGIQSGAIVQIFSVQGKLVYNHVYMGQNSINISTQELRAGSYILKIFSEDKLVSSQLNFMIF